MYPQVVLTRNRKTRVQRKEKIQKFSGRERKTSSSWGGAHNVPWEKKKKKPKKRAGAGAGEQSNAAREGRKGWNRKRLENSKRGEKRGQRQKALEKKKAEREGNVASGGHKKGNLRRQRKPEEGPQGPQELQRTKR